MNSTNNNKTVTEHSINYSNGKLLLTGEYVVLDGAISLAVPTKYGQSLKVETIDESKILWTSLDENGNTWFEGSFQLNSNEMLKQVQHDETSNRLIQILHAAKQLNSKFLNLETGFRVTTKLDFPKNWGLGTSSTLINNIAQWAQVDAYSLLEQTFGGSGYDIACAQNNTSITYQLLNNEILKQVQHDETRIIKDINFNPSFKDHLYFVHLNKKQNSRDGIKHYNEQKRHSNSAINQISDITSKVISCNSLNDFEILITEHEQIISNLTKQTPVKDLLFNDFKGCIKSLGAWGGDFVLATSIENPSSYFQNKGYNTIIPYKDMVL